jgi:hypothetical protein
VFVALFLLCLSCANGTPPARVESIDAFFNAERDVRFLLQTRQNRNNPQVLQLENLQSIQSSHYNPARPTRILTHGFLEDDGADINTATSAELLNYYDFNVIFVDWSEGSRTINYIAASGRVEGVGSVIARQIDFMHLNGLLDFNRLTVVGFSLGAHIAGHTGKNVRRGRIATILGLDPAGPLFSTRRPDGRLDRGDGTYVEAIHTNGPTVVLLGLGIGSTIGHADYFVNGGSSQSGCLTNTCSHSRAVEFYVESIIRNGFHALGCSNSILGPSSLTCRIQPGEWMGGDSNTGIKTGRGDFYLETNRRSPFAEGPFRP